MTGENHLQSERIARVVAELGEFLQEPVTLVKSVVDGDGFFCQIRSAPPRGHAFQFCWDGALGKEPGDAEISVSLFLYSRNQRLALPGHAEGSVLEIDYEGSLEHGGRWTNPHWADDALGEYLAYDSYSDD